MKNNQDDRYKSVKNEMRLRHIVMLVLAIVFSWVLWTIVNHDVYTHLSGKALIVEILKDFGEQVLETTILLELSLLYIRGIVKVFWDSPHNMKSVLIQVMTLAVLNGISSNIMGLAYSYIFPEQEHLFTKIAYTDYINLSVLTTAYLVVFLVNRYRDETDAHLEAEKRLEKEENLLLKTKLDNLALQTDNHFIFNCFSTLSGLMVTSPDDAKVFLQGLSSVYRYLVTNGVKNLVPLKDELSFVNDYSRLVSYRFSGVEITIDEDLKKLDAFICPVTLQSLVENAMKHNRHGKDGNLSIDVSLNGDWIRVANNILPREEKTNGTGKGLKTLKERYAILTDKDVSVIDDGKTFEVRVPILYLEDLEDESINH